MATSGNRRPVRMSRRQRQLKRQRQLLALGVSVVALVIIIIVAVSLKACGNKKNDTNADNIQQLTTTGTTAQAESSSKSDDDKSSQAAGEQNNNQTTEAASSSTSADNNQSGTSLGVTSKGFKIEQRDGATYIDGVLIANKTYALSSSFIPTNPDVPVTEARSNKSLDKDLMAAWKKLQAAASANGLNIYISSGYRSYQYQVTVYNNYVAKDGKAMADTYSSRPGNSEHQTGLCFDLNSINDSFADTAEGKWVDSNCYKYGFCIRFPKGKDAYTGYQYESWHLRYVGEELATKLYNNGDWISLEEYFGITSEYPN